MNLNQKTMISTLKIIPSVSLLLLLLLVVPHLSLAQNESLSLSVSPSLFEMSANPGQTWSSVIRVTNPNPYELSIYTDVVNFEPQGEAGQGKFIPLSDTYAETLGNWIKFENSEYLLRPEQTVEIPFTIMTPPNAPPGGHYAAILIGTKSLNKGSGVTLVETSQVITSLVFLSVSGEVVEEGSIREFSTTQTVAEKPEMTFELRFQNTGNVHVLPQGEIKILNMWGQERGVIPVNRQTLFGNVLPNSIRKYTFSWSGEWSLADMGRYTAIATLAYGQNGRKFVSAETSFWVIPWKTLAVVIISILTFIGLLILAIKAYIRRILLMAGITPEIRNIQNSRTTRTHRVSIVAPIEEGILDLRARLHKSDTLTKRFSTVINFVVQYKLFFLTITLIVIFIVAMIWYVRTASISERPYQIVIDGLDSEVTISSEQVRYEALKNKSTDELNQMMRIFPPIKIVNQSGVAGLAAGLRLQLEKKGYPVVELTSELGKSEVNTVIVYAPEYDKEALELSSQVYGALTSAYSGASGTETPIIIYVGKDLQSAVQ